MGIWNTIKVHKYWLILSFSQDVLLVPKRGVPGSFQAPWPVSEGPPALPVHYGIHGAGVGSHFAAPELWCLLDAPSSRATGQEDSFDIGLFQNGNCSINGWEFGAKTLLGALAKAGGEASQRHPKAAHVHLRRSGGESTSYTFLLGKREKNPIPNTKPRKSFMQSFYLCICNLVSQPACLINRFLFCPPRSSEEHWHVGSALAQPGWLKGSSSGRLAPNLLHFHCPTDALCTEIWG